MKKYQKLLLSVFCNLCTVQKARYSKYSVSLQAVSHSLCPFLLFLEIC